MGEYIIMLLNNKTETGKAYRYTDFYCMYNYLLNKRRATLTKMNGSGIDV